MLYAVPDLSFEITKVEEKADGIYLYSKRGLHRLQPVNNHILRVTYTAKEKFSNRIKPGIVTDTIDLKYRLKETDEKITLSLKKLTLKVNKKTASYAFYNQKGELYYRERDYKSKELEEFQAYKLCKDEDTKTSLVDTVDGVKEVVKEAKKVPDRMLYHTKMHFSFSEDEAIYGLGQQEEGALNLRGKTIYVHQANRKIAVPMLLSSRAYGILINTYSPMIFRDDLYGSLLYCEADEELDYFVIGGKNLDDVVLGYRFLTGKASLLPKWAFGYLQSQERYETQKEILEVAKKHRDMHIGLDGIILDWISWEDGKWGQKTFDKKRFPDPKLMTDKLHDMDVHFMISIWPTMSDNTENYREMKKADAFLPASNVYNALSDTARELYFKQAKEGLFDNGVDAWWCDSSEPLTVEWTHKMRMEPEIMYEEYCRELSMHLPADMTNVYPFYHAKTLYDGQRSVTNDKRVCNLTRSAYTGQQRFGTILWSGDTEAKWSTLKNQIAAGLNFCASGITYWTVDIGAFFIKKSNYWYWDGDYQDTINDSGYLELYTRWYEWAAFLPVFRGHGTDARRELYNFRGENDLFYNAMLKFNKLRYRLMPYIYSQAGLCYVKDASMIKLLAFDFSHDKEVLDIKDQYLFGNSIMVCPVTEPMYFEKNSKKLHKKKVRRVYLPKGCDWFDFWTSKKYTGGQWISAKATIDEIPLFVKAGSIIPFTKESEHVSLKDEIMFTVYAGKDASYELYEDAGDGYGYEQGEYTIKRYDWSEKDKILTDASHKKVRCKIIK